MLFVQWETVWVSCDGETPADKEFIGPVRYIPGPGFPGYQFPYTGQKGYLPPLVAVQFEMPYSKFYATTTGSNF